MPYRVQKIEDFVQQLESGDLKLRVRVLEVLKADILFNFFDVVLSTCIQMNWVWFECWPNLKLPPFIYLWCLVVQWVVPSQNWSAPLRRLISHLVLVPGCRYIIYILTLMLSLSFPLSQKSERAARKATIIQMATLYTALGGTLLNVGVALNGQGNQLIANGSFVGAGIEPLIPFPPNFL